MCSWHGVFIMSDNFYFSIVDYADISILVGPLELEPLHIILSFLDYFKTDISVVMSSVTIK